jgi:hypothetical protein
VKLPLALFAAGEPATAGQTAPETNAVGINPELLTKILSNPEMAALLTTLAKNLK